MIIKKINKIKICAILTTICFVISTLGANLYAIPTADNINKKYEDVFNKTNSISNEYGKITSSKDANSDITVINIQDLHCHPQTQKNIAKIIGEIADKYNLKKIYVEGGYGDIDVSWLNSIKDENVRKQAIEKLLEEGVLTGSEYYKITSNNNNVELKGIDEEKIHKDNVKRLAWIMTQQNKYKEITEKITKEIDILGKIYVNNRNKRFNRIIEDYSTNKTDSKTFYKKMFVYIKDINDNPDKYNNITSIRLEDYPNISKFMTLRKVSKDIDFKEVTQQLQIVINELKNKLPYGIYTKFLNETENLSNSQKVLELVMLLSDKEGINLEKYKSLKNFLESNYITKAINPIDLVQEERLLVSEIRKALSYNEEEYEITFVSDFNSFFKNYLEYKLTDADWKYFETYYNQFRQLYAKYATVDRIKEIEQDFDEINKYYNINDQRNNIFIKNLLKDEQINIITKNKVRLNEEILKNSKEVIIAVTGGFHSSELEQMLASNDVNTIVITPKIYEDIKHANDKYIELIGIQSRVKSQALSYTIASCTTDIDKQKILLSIVKDIVGENTQELEKLLGNKIDLSLLDESTPIDEKQKNTIRNLFEITIDQVLKNVPMKGMSGTILPNIDDIMLNLAQQLVNNGIYFSEGVIFDIENSSLNGKDIKGIPAEIYSRMMPALQKALLKTVLKDEGQNVTQTEEKQNFQDYFSIAASLKDKNKFFRFLYETAHIWEELVFRTFPVSLSVLPVTSFLPVPAILAFFIISQFVFIKAHGNNFKEQIKQKFLPTTVLSIPYVLALLFAPGIPAIIFSTIIGFGLHKYFNLILKAELSVFKKEQKEEVFTVSEFLANKQRIDLNNVQDQQLLAKLLDGKELLEHDVADIVSKMDLDDVSQSNKLLELFYKQRVISNNNKRKIVVALAQKTDVTNSNQMFFLKNILLSDKYSLSVDEKVASILIEKFDFYNKKFVDFLVDYFKLKNYDKNFQNTILNNKIINKIDINDYNQIKLLSLFSSIDDKILYSLLTKFNFNDKKTLQYLFKIISKQNLTQKKISFAFILNKFDLENDIDFKILQDIIFSTEYIDESIIDNIFNVLDFSNKFHLSLIKNIINKKNISISIIESFTKHMDVNNNVHTELVKDLIGNFFRINTADLKLIFFEKIGKELKKINIEQFTEAESYVFKIFTEELILNIQKGFNNIRNENIRINGDKIIVYFGGYLGATKEFFNELLELVNILSAQENALSEQAQNNLQETKKQISYIEDMMKEKVTIKEFAEKFGFRFSKQTPNTYIDSNRYSFTKLLSLFPERILKRKVNTLSPTYFIEKDEVDKKSLKTLLIKFDAYMKLLDENVYVINKFSEVTSFDSQFDNVINHINSMIDCLSVFNTADAGIYRRALNDILEKISNNQTTIEEQKKFSLSDIYKTETIYRLINQIHQNANLDFVSNIRESYSSSLSRIQNVFVSKDNRTIAAYNLSEKPMNPEIKRLLLMLIENPDFSTDDKSQIFIKDNIFLWNGLIGDHSARVLIDFSRDSRDIFVDFSEGERTSKSLARILNLKKIFANFGFYIDLYNNNNSLVATINKDKGLTNATDICDLAQKAIIALNNAGSLNRTNLPKQCIDVATFGIMDIYKKCFFVSDFEHNIINTKVNNINFLNRILSYLQLPKIPFSEQGMFSYIKRGLFRIKTKTLGQNTINKYINNPIEQAFATGYLKINEKGVLERNEDYNPILSIANKLNNFLDKEIGDSQEKEMLNQGAIFSQVPEQDLNLKTCGHLGRYILKTGYINLSNGTLNDNIKGEFLSIRILIDKDGIIRYSESELVGLPEYMQNKTGRLELTAEQLQQILSKQGYDIDTPEKLTNIEILNYRIKLQEDISISKMPIAYGILLSKPKETNSVVGVIGEPGNIFVDKFASPENVDIAVQNKISLFIGGSYSSHAGILLREYNKTAMIINDSQITKEEALKIKFYQSKNSVVKIGDINTQEIEETEVTLKNKDILIVDLNTNRLILFPNSEFKGILLDLQQYIDNNDTIRIKEFIEKYRNNNLIERIIEYIYYQAGDNEWLQDILSEYSEYSIEKNTTSQKHSRFIQRKKLIIKRFLPHTANGKAYRFGERESLDKTKVGTKSANQSKIYLNINQLKQDTGVTNVAVPNGMAIGYSILEDILGQEYTQLYGELETLINKKDKNAFDYNRIQNILPQITNLINGIGNSKIKDYIGKDNLRFFKNTKVIVRSSGIGEDSQEYSAAGIAESYGNIKYEDISNAVRNSLSSFFSKKAIDYMLNTGKMIKPTVFIEEWIEADKAGIMMSENDNGNRLIQVINGQGEDIVSGRTNPYSFEIDISTREKIDGNYTNKKTLTAEQLENLTKIMEWLEEVEGVPVDIEFVIKDGIIYILQVRPITTLGYAIPEEVDYESVGDRVQKERDSYISDKEADYEFDSDKSYGKTQSQTQKLKVKSKYKKVSGVKKQKTHSLRVEFNASVNDIISQPEGMTIDDIIKSFTKLSKSKDSSDKSLNLNQQQIKDYLIRLGISRKTVEDINFNEGLPDYIISLLKSRNSQVKGTTIDPRKTLIENLREHPILFSLAIETFTRVYEKELGGNATLGALLAFLNHRSSKKLYEATCTDLRGYFGEFYAANTLIAGIIPDKRAGPIIIRPELPADNNIRGYDIYNPIDGVKTQVKTGGSGIVHHHFKRYWKPFVKLSTNRIMAIPVLTTKNIKNNSFGNDNRVQGIDVTTETVTKFAHELVSVLNGISYKQNIPAVGNIRLKDLIDSFKGFPTENSITLDELINILDKNQTSTTKKTKQYSKTEKSQIVYFDGRKINVDSIANQDIVVTINPEQIHIISVNDEQILLNEERKRELSKEEYDQYGIEKVEYDEFGNITYIIFKEGVSLSNLTIDGKIEGSKENNIPFSEQEIKGLNTDTQTQGYIDVYLDGDVDEICHLIKKAATENKLVVFHLFEKGFNTSQLTPSQLLDVYKKTVLLISSRFHLSDIFALDFDDDSKYTDYGIDFFFEEILKNAFVRGNFGQFEEPIALNIKLDEKKNLVGFSVYNKANEGEIYKYKEVLAKASHFMFTGDSRSTDIMLNNPIRKYSLDKKLINGTEFKKADVSLRDTIDMEKYQLEQDYKKSAENISITDIALQAETTKKKLHKIGTRKYTKQYLEQTGKQEKNLTLKEKLKIEEQAKEYRFTMAGLLDGVKIEIFAFFSRSFIYSHSNLPLISKVAVHTVRILSIAIGTSFAFLSFSVLPIGAAIISTIILSPLSTILSSAVMHFLWNIIAIITNNKDWLLQSDRIIIPTEKTELKKGRALTDEEKESLELNRIQQEEFYNSIYIYQPNKILAKDVLEIFNNLVQAMVSLGLITEEEKAQYRLHYYYEPTTNAFTIRNSKDVFIFSQLLYEIDKRLKKEGKTLTKDIIAAIISHELRHTIQENRNFEYKKREKQFGVNKGSDKRKEYDADTGGLDIMDTAGYNPKAMQELLSFFCKISEDGDGYSIFDLLDAHPNSKDRLKIVSSILESKDIAFMNMDKVEQPISVKSISNYFTLVSSMTNKILALGYRNRIVRKLLISFMLDDKAKYFTSEEKNFLKRATNLQKNFIYELLFPQEKASKYDFSNLSQKEKEELFDFIIDILNIYKIKDLNSLFFGELITSIDMTKDRWEKLNKFKKRNDIFIEMMQVSNEASWFYANNREYLSKEELVGLTYKLANNADFFLTNSNISTEQYMKILFNLLKTTKMYVFSQYTIELLNEIENAEYLSKQEKLEYIYLLYSPKSGYESSVILRFLNLNKFSSVSESILNLFNIAEFMDKEEKFSSLWGYIIEEYGEQLSLCSLDELEKISLATKSEEFDTFVLGWFIKSINPNFKIHFVSNFQESKNPQFIDGISLWPKMFQEGDNFSIILKMISSVDNSEIIKTFKLLQDKMIDEEIVNENISFITYQILKNKGLLDEYKYDFKYLLCFVKNQDEIKIDIADSTTDYPIEYLKDIVEIQFPQASFLDLGSKYRFTKYFIHLAELYSFSIDYRKETFESAIELIKKHFSIARTFFKKNSEGEYATDEQKQISETEENLRNMEITRSFIYELHEIFNIEPVSKTIEFKSGKDSYQYDYFEINKDLLEQVPTTKQAQQLINLFDILKKELPKENVEIYAKIIYTLLKKNSYLSVFNSAEDHIKLVDFLFEGFSKAKDDYINEILDRYNISPSQYDELKNKTTLVQYEQQTEDANVAVAKEEILYFTIENITNQEDRINFLLWLMSSNQDSKYYRTYTLGNIKCKNNDDVVINFDSFRTEFQLMSKTERENVIRTIFLGSNGILNKKESKEKNISEVIIGLQNVLFNNLFFSDEKVNNLNVAMANMFKKIFEIVFRNISDERKVVFVNNLFSALIDIKNETENSDMEEGELRARQLGRLIVAIGVNSGMAVLKLLQILSNNKVFEQLDDKYGYIINEEVSKVRSENEPLSKFVIFKYLERLGLLDKVEVVGKCLGSASIGLTYLIKFIGKKMFDVIKIKRPNIMKNYEEDFFVFSKIREYIISETSPLPEQYKKMIPKAEHLKNLFDEELNFGIESENLRQFSKQLKARNSEILVPELINNGRVLFTQTSAKGHSLNNIELSLAERKEINFKILKEFFTEVFFDAQNSPTGQALYHADLHAGNIFITANGNITFIDLGGVGNVDIKRSKSLKKIFIFLCLGNYNGFISSLKEFNRNIPRQLSSASKSKIKEILERNVPLENKFADLFEIFNNLENMDRDFLMFMQSISKIAVYIDELELIDEIGKPNLKDILEYGKKLLNKDLSGVEKFVRENIEVLKKLAVSIYMKNYNGFIKALSLYNQSIVETLDADEKEQIKNILKRKMTLQEKLVDLIEILDKLNIVDENFLLLLEITNNIIYYVGEAELKDIITKIFVSKIFTFSSKKQKKMEQTETRIDIEKDSILEIVLSKCKDISKDKIKSLENKLQNINKDAIKMCLKNSIVNLNLNQIIIFIDIANYLYKKEFITGKNEQDKINLLFKVVTRFNFNDEQIKKLFEMDAKFIDEILKKVEKINSKRKQKSLLKKFLKEKNKLDLEIIDMEILKTMLDFSNKGNPIFDILPSDIAKKILNDPKKLKFLLNFLSAGNNAEYNNDSMDFDLSLIVKLIDLPYEILETLPNGRYYHGEANYMYNFHKFCDLYEKCYDENKFYNTHKFVITLLNFTTVKYRDISSRYYKFYTKIKNIGIILSWKIPVINKFMKFISTHKKLTKKDKQIINIFREAVDIKTLEEISKTVYKLKLKTILKEAHKFDIPISIDNVKFKSLLMCLKNGIPITSEVRTKIANTTDFNDFKPYVYNLLSNKKKMMERFSFLDKNAYIWEEIVFKVIPIVVSAFNPVVGLYVFVSSQVFFILAHFIPKILKGKNLNEAFVETKELIFSLPTLMSLLFTLLLGINTLILDLDSSSFFQLIIPIILTLFSIPSIIIHKQYNEEHTLNPLSIAKNILEARQLKAFITKYDVVETDGFITKTVKTILGTIAKETNKIKHVIIDYKTIKASGIKQAIELFGTNARLNEEGQISVGIVEDIEEIRDSFTLINTGIKIDGSSIYRIKNSDLLMYGAKGQTSIKVAQALNGTKEIKEALQEMGLTETSNTETEGVVMIDGVGIEINNGLLEIGEIELEGKTPQQIKEYITTALEIKRALGIMYGQKTIIDLKNLTGSALIKAVENGRARKVITEEQYRKLELNKEKIKELKEKGIEIYVACNEIKDEYRQNEISGQIIRDSKTNKAYIYDYYSMDKTEIDEITNQKDLAKLEDKIVNGENLIMIDIDLLKKSFQGSNIIESFTKLGALTGKIKITMRIGNIGIRDIENVGYNIRFEEIPEISQRDIQNLVKATTKDEILNIIGQKNGFAIILTSLKEENVNRFKELILERILAKKALTESVTTISGIELEDKKLEILLGKLLFRQLNYTDKEQVKEELISQGQLMNVLEKLKEMDNKQKGIETQEQQELVNTIIQLILLYDGQRVKGNQLQKQTSVGDISSFRSMLAAA